MAAITGKQIKTGLTELEKKILKRLIPGNISSTDQSIKITRSDPESLSPTVDLSAVGDGGITTLTGTEGVSVTGTGRAKQISGKSLNDRVTAHGQAIAVNRNLANKNTENLLKLMPEDKKITTIKAGNNVTLDYAPVPADNTKGILTVNATSGSNIPDTRLFAANSGTNDRLVSNNIHACEFYLGSATHHDKGVVMWEGNKVDVPNRATKEMGRWTHNDATGECHCRMGLPGKHSFYYYQKDWNSDGELELGYGAKAGKITSSQLKALALLKPLEMGSSKLPVTTIDAGDGITFGYSGGDLTVNAIELELEDGTQTKKVIKKIKAGTNISFALANDILEITSSGSMTESAFKAMLLKVVKSDDKDILKIETDNTDGKVAFKPQFDKYQLWDALSDASKQVMRDGAELQFIQRSSETQLIKFIRKHSANTAWIGYHKPDANTVYAGYSFFHEAHVFPGKGNAYAEGSLILREISGNTHQVAFKVAQRKIRSGSESSKEFTPTGIKLQTKVDELEAKLVKLTKLLRIKYNKL